MWQDTTNDLLSRYGRDTEIPRHEKVSYNRLIFQACSPYMRPIRWQGILNQMEIPFSFYGGIAPDLLEASYFDRTYTFPFDVVPLKGLLSSEDIVQLESSYIEEFLFNQTLNNQTLNVLTNKFVPLRSLVVLANHDQMPPGYNAIDSDFLEELINADQHTIKLISHDDIIGYMTTTRSNSYAEMIEQIRNQNSQS